MFSLNVVTFAAIGDCTYEDCLERSKIVSRIVFGNFLRDIATQIWQIKNARCEMTNLFIVLMTDVACHRLDATVSDALEELSKLTSELKIFGSYPMLRN